MISVEHLSKRYGELAAVDDLSFAVPEGQILGFLGANGAGKSTTMKMLTGFIPPSAGKASVAGFDVFESPLEVKRRIGYLPETPPLYPEMTVAAYLLFVGRLKGLAGRKLRAEVDRAMAATAVADRAKKLIGTLSKGYRHRVGLAQALLGDPPLLILDEPTEGLDPRQRQEVLGLIKGLEGKRTVVLSTHILSEVKAICDHVLIIHRGKLVAHDTIDAVSKSSSLDDVFIRLTAE